jgi:hypothetical protein
MTYRKRIIRPLRASQQSAGEGCSPHVSQPPEGGLRGRSRRRAVHDQTLAGVADAQDLALELERSDCGVHEPLHGRAPRKTTLATLATLPPDGPGCQLRGDLAMAGAGQDYGMLPW